MRRLRPGDLVIHTDVPTADYGELIAIEDAGTPWDSDSVTIQWSKGDQNHGNSAYLKRISPLTALAFEGK